MPALIQYDTTNMFSRAVGKSGITIPSISTLQKRLKKAKDQLIEDQNEGKQGWLNCVNDAKIVQRIFTLVRAKQRFKTCLVIGIGGSDLGARAVWHALKSTSRGMQMEFLGGNADPDEVTETLKRLDLQQTLVNVISKSGDTIEPMSVFFIVREALMKQVGHARHADHIVATTDETSGSLLECAKKEGYATLPVPKNIGGRFSVLTSVGLFPLACAGLNIRAMLRGARETRDDFMNQAVAQNSPSLFAALHYVGDTQRGLSIHILMPYAESLKEFGRWYRQLWAESLGKKNDRSGKPISVGPTPIAALGATDQHSQMQLYAEGPANKIVTFIEVQRFRSNLRVPASAVDLHPLAYLARVPLATVLHAERQATAEALRQAHRPNGTLVIPNVSHETLGALFMFFQIATAIAGELYNIDTYDQPGVEAGKNTMYALLGRPDPTRGLP